MKEKIGKRKSVYLELLRVVAIYFVIFNHTNEDGFMLFTRYSANDFRFWIYLFISIFCKFSVPLFFAISGALTLGKEDEPFAVIFRKRMLKIIGLLLFYSVVYYAHGVYINSKVFSWNEMFLLMYSKQTRTLLWYLYAYIAYLISLPFLRALVKSLKEKWYYYMIVIAIIFNGIIPIAEYYIFQGKYSLNSNMRLSWLVSNIVLYPCIGYFLHHKLEFKEKARNKIILLWAMNVISIIITCLITCYKGEVTGVFNETASQSFHKSLVVINAITIYVTVKYLCERYRMPEKLERLIVELGKCTFGVYLLHMLIKDQPFTHKFLESMILNGMNYMLACMIQCFVIMVIGYISTYILLRIPILKKLVGG